MISDEKYNEFQTHAEALIKWLNDNKNPHATIFIDINSATVYEGSLSFTSDKFIKD